MSMANPAAAAGGKEVVNYFYTTAADGTSYEPSFTAPFAGNIVGVSGCGSASFEKAVPLSIKTTRCQIGT